MEVSSINHLILWMLVIMTAQIDGAKKKREAAELAPGDVIVGPPFTLIPEGPHPCRNQPCGVGNTGKCVEFCDEREGPPIARTKKRGLEDFVLPPNECDRRCTCCGQNVGNACKNQPCGNGGTCQRFCKIVINPFPVEVPTTKKRSISDLVDTPFAKCPSSCQCCNEIQDCVFNNKTYKSGERIEGICVDVTCKHGQWYSNGYIDECCQKCSVMNCPYIKTFDGVNYFFNGKCNYSITQDGTSQFPPYAVYGDFIPWFPSLTFLDATTFKDNENTLIKMTNADKEHVLVNNDDFEVTYIIQQVMSGIAPLAWRVGANCIRFLGTQRLMVEYCWNPSFKYSRWLVIYAYPSLVDKLYGLCGYFNYYREDDLTHRDGTITPPPDPWWSGTDPNAFGESWKTNVPDSDCRKWITGISLPAELELSVGKRQAPNEDPCVGEALEPFLEICTENLTSVNWNGYYPTLEQLEIQAMICAKELCAFEVDGTDIDEDEYLAATRDMLQRTIMRDVMTTPGARPPKPCEACKGTCGVNGTCRYRCDSTEQETDEGRCKGEHCKCCEKKPTCGGDCGRGGTGTCRSCSCNDDEEKIEGPCNLNDCLCCRKKPVCENKCRYRRKTYPCVDPAQCKKKIKRGKGCELGCDCCKKRK